MLDPLPTPELSRPGRGGWRPAIRSPAIGARAGSAMVGLVVALLALPAAAGASPLPSVPLPSTTVARADESPLLVSIDTLTPSTLPRRGRIVVSGTVTNTTEDVWDIVRVFPLTSFEPIRTRGGLAAAAASDPLVPIGNRLLGEGLFDELGSLAPGGQASYVLRIPVSQLEISGRQGVYWWGVHALGEVAGARDTAADGRARTFLPMVDTTRRSARGLPAQRVAMLLSLRRGQAHRPDGRLKGVRAWARDLGPDGRLRRTADLVAAAGDRPVTILVDPAVPAAAALIARGNPPRSLRPTAPESAASPGPEQETQQETESPSPSSDGDAGGADETAEQPPWAVVAVSAASSWLSRFGEVAADQQVLELPYGDVDVATLIRQEPDLYARSRRYSQVLSRLGARPIPAISPPNGHLDAVTLASVEPGTTVIVSDQMLPRSSPPVVGLGGTRMIATSTSAVAGGPGPDDPLADVAMRQRILAEAAVRFLRGGSEPLVVALPGDWAPTSGLRFFTGFDDLAWLRLTTVGEAAGTAPVTLDADQLREPGEPTAVPSSNADAAAALVATGDVVERILTSNDRVGTEIAGVALTTVSYAAAERPGAALRSAERTRTWLEDHLGRIRIEAPSSVTLSNERGAFSVTVVNGLGEPVTLGLVASTDSSLTITTPETLELGPDERTSIPLAATTTELGVHTVELTLTDAEGNLVGSSASVPVRALQVGDVIWVILGTGVTFLFAAIVLRLARRIMAARRSRRGRLAGR